jgi:3-hydroxyacyl-CoA dehydrogenase
MSRSIQSVAVIGGGTMGSGIAAASAIAGCRVLILESDDDAAAKARERTLAAAQNPEEREAIDSRLRTGTVGADLATISEYDWVCEAIVEDLGAKRDLFTRLEPLRRAGSVVSTNTSGIPLRDITRDLPARLRRDIVVTHFFNPVRVMRLLEIVPGSDTETEVVESLADFCRDRLGKGVVHAKDTVNFIANRIGCFWMLSGLHIAERFRAQGLTTEVVDALMSAPVGLPATGLYGLIDLIGLDVMDYVGKNLALNLPVGDAGHAYTSFPAAEQALLARGQLGRKSGGGFYRLVKTAEGGKRKEVFDLANSAWRPLVPATLDPRHTTLDGLLLAEDGFGKFAWDLLGGTLLYAADLVPAIADDIVNIDRAMRWGFAWAKGPFELLDALGPRRVAAKLTAEGKPLPALLSVLVEAGGDSFYRAGGAEALGPDGQYHPVAGE